jgi:DinB family protein
MSDDVQPLSPSDIVTFLAASIVTVDVEMAALDVEGGRWRPAPGEWCANEVVGHLIEAERRGFAGRIRTILAEDRPKLEGWDQPAVAAARRDCQKVGTRLAAEFRALRKESLDLVAGLKPADLERSGLHPAVGELRIRDLLGEWVHHDRNHIRQLLANTQARVWPQMGNAQRFSTLEAE